MNTRGCKSQKRIARSHVGARQDRLALDRTDSKAGEIIIAAMIEPRHLGRLPADQRAARLPASFGNSADHSLRRAYIELVAGVIVEEEKRLRSLYDEIVDAHGDEIDSDGMMHARLDGDLDLGADPVVCRDQHRIAEAAGLEIEESTKSAKRTVAARSGRGASQGLDGFDERVS